MPEKTRCGPCRSWGTTTGSYRENARRDLAANDVFWAKYEGKIAEVSNQINDAYLKSNGQEQGVKSYDKMVDMLVVYVLDILAE